MSTFFSKGGSGVRFRQICTVAALCAAPELWAQNAAAEDAKQVMADPPLLEMAIAPSRVVMPKSTRLEAAPAGAPAAGTPREALLDLNIVYTSGQLYNPATGSYDQVKLRSYQGTRVDPDVPFISPRIEVNPGDTVRITLDNQLPSDPSCIETAEGGTNVPHCFNGTNLHTHGLWVNPGGNGDNVLISINPGVSFQYEYNIPSDHPAGTFWYHTHRHGSTALQVSSGMAGALIVRGNRPPTQQKNGDLDVLLRPTDTQKFRERVVVLQQIQYACRDAEGNIKLNPDDTYRCDPGDVGEINDYDLFGPGAWAASGRYTSINGRIIPTFEGARAGQIERWRVIHGGVRDTVNLELRELIPAASTEAAKAADDAMNMRADQQDQYIQQRCKGDALTQHLVAADGLTTAAVAESASTVFQPAYRWDALMVFPKPGIYCVIDGAVPAPGNVDPNAPPSRRLLGFVNVAAGENVAPADTTAYLQKQLIAAAKVNIPADVRDAVVADLQNDLKLTRFLPHADLSGVSPVGTQKLEFNIDVTTTPATFEVDGEPYKSDRIDRTLVLGTTDEWTLTSGRASHPFHIHVNPFQVVAVYDPNGKDVSGPDAVDDYSGTVDPQYRGLKGVYKDSLWVKNAAPAGSTVGQTYRVVVRSKYERYIGDFVLHCHILDHEDQGMMQNVQIVLPDGDGAPTSKGHH